jgi:hypothetical protein
MGKPIEARLKIRRVQHHHSLKNVPLDGVDMFLLSLVEDEIELSALTEIAPRNSLECLRRVLRLGQLGLLQLQFASHDERLLAQGCDEAAAQELLDNANTLRPPPPAPTQRIGAESTPRRSGASRSVLSDDDVDEPKTGIRRRPTPPASQPVKLGKAVG